MHKLVQDAMGYIRWIMDGDINLFEKYERTAEGMEVGIVGGEYLVNNVY